MNFYQHQDAARHRSGLLIGYFVAAVILIVVLINLVVYWAMIAAGGVPVAPSDWIREPYILFVSLAVIGVIALSSLWTTLRLRGGGKALAKMVGARRVDPSSSDPAERQLMNVVEEMSIASGVTVPELYVLDDEPGINAFVAGTRPSETVMVVTQGALDNFSRDELQGVVAHEYSHIFNQDMSLNMRLMGFLAGILFIGQIGRILLHSGANSRGKNSSQFALVGLAVFIIGYIGIFFGNLIKAAVSRQREFLADASAVQFTRHPDGIGGALLKIRNHTQGSTLNSGHADDLSHFCFGASIANSFGGLMATHPPLDKRIAAVSPHLLDVSSGTNDSTPHASSEGLDSAATPFSGFAGGEVSATNIAASVGTVNAEHLAYAHDFRRVWLKIWLGAFTIGAVPRL